MRIPLSIAVAAAVMVLASIPLIFKKVPRNGFYGVRTHRTMSGTEEQWYAVNRTGGTAMLIAGMVSLFSCFVVPRLQSDFAIATLICTGVLVLSSVLALGVTLTAK